MPQRSPETNKLIKYLEACHAENRIATYAEMSALVHYDVQRNRKKLDYALRVCLTEKKVDFEVVPNLGYKPVTNERVGSLATGDAQKKMRGTARKWRNRLDAVPVDSLSGSALHAHVAGYAKLEIAECALSPELNKKIDSAVKQQHLTGRAGLEYARQAAIALIDVS